MLDVMVLGTYSIVLDSLETPFVPAWLETVLAPLDN